MLKLYIEGILAHLAEGSTLEMVIKNPFFVHDFTQRDYSYPFSISATPDMRKLFEHVENRETVTDVKDYECLLVFGVFSRRGLVRVTGFDGSAYEVHVSIAAFSLESNDTPLNQLSRPLTGSLQDQWEDGITKVWPETPVYFPTIRNNLFYGEEEDAFVGLVNHYRNGIRNNSIGADGYADNFYGACPMPALLEVLRLGVEAAGFKLAGKAVEDDALRKAWIFNEGNIGETSGPYRYTATRNTSYRFDLDYDYTPLEFQSFEPDHFTGDSFIAPMLSRYTFSVFVEWWNPFGDVDGNNLFLGVYVNGSLVGQEVQPAGSYGLSLTTENILLQQGDTVRLQFRYLNAQGEDIDVNEILFEAEIVHGKNEVYEYQAPTDLADFLPETKFGDFVSGLLNLRGLVAIPDEQHRILYLEPFASIYSLHKQKDMDPLPYEIEKEELGIFAQNQIVRYKEPREKDEGVVRGKGLSDIWVYENRQWKKYALEPENIEAEKIEINLLPILATSVYSFSSSPTLHIDNVAGSRPGDLYIGLFDGRQNGYCPASYTLPGLDLRLDDQIDDSILRAYITRKRWLNARNRKKEIIFYHADTIPTSHQLVIWNKQAWVWEEARLIYSTDKPMEVQLRLL